MIVTQKIPRGGVAQLGEHLPCKQGVMGSIPIISTTQQRVGTKIPLSDMGKRRTAVLLARRGCRDRETFFVDSAKLSFEVIENRIKRRRVEKTDREDKDLDRVDRN